MTSLLIGWRKLKKESLQLCSKCEEVFPTVEIKKETTDSVSKRKKHYTDERKKHKSEVKKTSSKNLHHSNKTNNPKTKVSKNLMCLKCEEDFSTTEAKKLHTCHSLLDSRDLKEGDVRVYQSSSKKSNQSLPKQTDK